MVNWGLDGQGLRMYCLFCGVGAVLIECMGWCVLYFDCYRD